MEKHENEVVNYLLETLRTEDTVDYFYGARVGEIVFPELRRIYNALFGFQEKLKIELERVLVYRKKNSLEIILAHLAKTGGLIAFICDTSGERIMQCVHRVDNGNGVNVILRAEKGIRKAVLDCIHIGNEELLGISQGDKKFVISSCSFAQK